MRYAYDARIKTKTLALSRLSSHKQLESRANARHLYVKFSDNRAGQKRIIAQLRLDFDLKIFSRPLQ